MQNLEHVLLTLRQHQLFVDLSKHYFAQQSISIDKQGVTIDPANVEVLQKWPHPSTLTNLRSFLGLTNFYRKFIPSYLDIGTPLHQLIRIHIPFRWIDVHTTTFNNLKHRLSSAPILVFPDLNQPFEIETNASQFAPEAVLKQNGHSVAYHS